MNCDLGVVDDLEKKNILALAYDHFLQVQKRCSRHHYFSPQATGEKALSEEWDHPEDGVI